MKLMAYLSLMKYQIGEKISKIQLTTFGLLQRHTRGAFHIYDIVFDLAVNGKKIAKKNT